MFKASRSIGDKNINNMQFRNLQNSLYRKTSSKRLHMYINVYNSQEIINANERADGLHKQTKIQSRNLNLGRDLRIIYFRFDCRNAFYTINFSDLLISSLLRNIQRQQGQRTHHPAKEPSPYLIVLVLHV